MNSLKQKIIELIHTQGPITVSQYMTLVLADSEFGYYKTTEPFGREGDFITAPEISQLFGEMVAFWVISAWEALDQPSDFILAEMGPGRGTLMADVLRVITKIKPEMISSSQVILIESSARLIDVQKKTLQHYYNNIEWHAHFSQIPQKPIIFFANELFDALPIHQFLIKNGSLQERLITVNQENDLAFAVAKSAAIFQTTNITNLQNGTIIETSPARDGLMDEISTHIAHYSGYALVIDYGSLLPATGDTLQAISKHQKVDIFAHPGQDDLTSHVDFATLRNIAQSKSCKTASMTQAEFLLSHGLIERAGQLGAHKDVNVQEQIHRDVERLAAPNQMGELFKALIICDDKHIITNQ